jgi:hypothetical protein
MNSEWPQRFVLIPAKPLSGTVEMVWAAYGN